MLTHLKTQLNTAFCGRLLYFINVGLLYARMALLCVSFREDNAALATMAWRVSREVTCPFFEGSEDFRSLILIFDPDPDPGSSWAHGRQVTCLH